MPTYTKETALYDTGVISDDIDDASKTATNYISVDSTGIRIANSNPATATTYQHQTATNTEFVVGGTSKLDISGDDGIRIGASNESNLQIDYHSFKMLDSVGDAYLHVGDLRDRSGYFVKELEFDSYTVMSPTINYADVENDLYTGTHTMADYYPYADRTLRFPKYFMYNRQNFGLLLPNTGAISLVEVYVIGDDGDAEFPPESISTAACTVREIYGGSDGDAYTGRALLVPVSEVRAVIEDGDIYYSDSNISVGTVPAFTVKMRITNLDGYYAYTLGTRREQYDVAPRSYVLGNSCAATMPHSMAIGTGTRAVEEAQLVIGKNNVPHDGPLVIGNGDAEDAYWDEEEQAYVGRSNALTVDWNGLVEAANIHNVMSVYPTAEVTMTGTVQQKVPVRKMHQVGQGFEVVNGFVRCLLDGCISVEGMLSFSGFNTGNVISVIVYRCNDPSEINNTNLSNISDKDIAQYNTTRVYDSSGTTRACLTIPKRIFNVEAGMFICIAGGNTSTSTGKILASGNRSYFTLEYV